MADDPTRGYIHGTPLSDVLTGSELNDVIDAHLGDDLMYGKGGIDLLWGAGGDDLYDGGEGDDYAWFSQANIGIRVDLAIKGPQDTGEGRDTFVSIENILGSPYNDVFKGDEGKNEIQANNGDDLIEGRGGDDVLYGQGGADEIHGGNGADLIFGGDGNDQLYGDADDDTFFAGFGVDLYDGGAGFDKVVFLEATTGLTLDMMLTRQEVAPSTYVTLVSIERLDGTGFADQLFGDSLGNTFSPGGGNDLVDGRGGADTYVSSARLEDLQIQWTLEGWKITDTRPGSPEGVDLVRNVETLIISNGLTYLGDGMPLIVSNILRLSAEKAGDYAADLTYGLNMGTLTPLTALNEAIKKAGATTSVATLAYEFFTGKIPSLAGVDYLVSPTGPNANNLNSAYYQSFNLENRYINFAVNLGKLGEGKDAFAAKYGSMSLFDATREAYKSIFGAAPTDAKIHAMIDSRVDYFAAYGGDGASGVGTKAAMVGWLLAEAQKADLGVMVRSNDAWLTDLADGSAPFGVDLLSPANGYYKSDFIFGGA